MEQETLELGGRVAECAERENAPTPISPYPDLLGQWAIRRRAQDAELLANRQAWSEYRIARFGYDACQPYTLERQV